MSDTVKQIIERAINDEAFRTLLFNDLDKALNGYDVTENDKKLLEGINEGNFDEFAGGLGDRTTKGLWNPSG